MEIYIAAVFGSVHAIMLNMEITNNDNPKNNDSPADRSTVAIKCTFKRAQPFVNNPGRANVARERAT